MTRILSHFRSNVVGYIALFFAIAGTAWAANTVGSADVIDNSLMSVDLKDGAGVKGVDVVNQSLTGTQIDESTLGRVANAQKLNGHPASDFIQQTDKAGGDVAGPYLNLQVRSDSVGSAQVKDDTLRNADLSETGALGWGAVSSSGGLSRNFNVNSSWREAKGTYCIDPASDVNAKSRVIVATPNLNDDDTSHYEYNVRPGSATTAEWDSQNLGGCPAGTFEIDTYERTSSGCFSGCYVDFREDEGFFFVIR